MNRESATIMDIKTVRDIKIEYKILSDIFLKMGDGFLIMDKERKIQFMNQHLIEVYGEQLGMKCHEVFFDTQECCKGCSFKEILKHEKAISSHTKCDKDKFGRWLEMTCVTSKIPSEGEAGGETTYIIEMVHDITARKKLEDVLRVKNLELKQKNEELEKFVYTVSHDLKSPIFSLQGVVGVLIEDHASKLDGEIREYLDDIKNSAHKMGYLVQDLLDLSRVGRTRNPRVEVPAKEIIDDALEQMEFQLKTRKVELYIEESLPVCYCDKQMIVRALVNLIDNAIKFVGENTCPHIEIGCRAQGDYHVFSVKDNGIGIDTKYHDKIFEIFQTLDEIKDPKGTGVGLAIVKRIAEAHLGKVWVESQKGKGATFFISIPKPEIAQLKKQGMTYDDTID